MRDRYFIAIMAVTGLLIGFAAVQLIQDSPNSDQRKYCSRVGDSLQQNGSFNGTVNCYPPGVLNVDDNLSENIENSTNLQCVCRNSYDGGEQIFSIRRTR